MSWVLSREKGKKKQNKWNDKWGTSPIFSRAWGCFYLKSLAICEVGVKLFLFLKVVLLNLSSSVYLG